MKCHKMSLNVLYGVKCQHITHDLKEMLLNVSSNEIYGVIQNA